MNHQRFKKLQFRNGKQLKNRVVVPPMSSETASLAGDVTEATLAHYAKLTESKAGLVMVEYSYVHLSGRSDEHQLGIYSDDQVNGLSLLSKAIHQGGGLAGIQLTHSGGKSSRELTGGVLMAPSAIATPVKDQTLEIPIEMTNYDIELWKEAFIASAGRAVKAGFDLIELHAAHGYGLNQWLSPITNLRIDQYGRLLMNRSRLILEIIQKIKANWPDLLIAVRMPGQDFLEGGLEFNDTIAIAQALEKVGVDLIDVSSGIGGWRRPRDRKGQGYLVNEASLIQEAVSIPVIGVGGIETGSFIDELLIAGKISLAAVGRAILQNPKQWGEVNL